MVRRRTIFYFIESPVAAISDNYIAEYRRSHIAAAVFCVSFPSTGLIYKYSGALGLTLYIAIAAAGIWAWFWMARHRPHYVAGKSSAIWMALTLALLALLVIVVYPAADSGAFGRGSDRDDALELATAALRSFRFPYHETTYLGNSISPMPGAVILAVPFSLLGGVAWQNVFWLGAFAYTLRRCSNSWRAPTLFFLLLIVAAPVIAHEVITGGDLLANSLYVTLFAWWLIASVSEPRKSRLWTVALAILLGVSLSSRALFVLILPLLFFALYDRLGLIESVKCLAIVVASCLVVTLPFYFYDPAGFSPLHTASKLGRFGRFFPYPLETVTALSMMVSLCLAVWRRRRTDWLGNCALTLSLPVIAAVLLSSLAESGVNLEMANYGLSALFFGVLGFAYLPIIWDDRPAAMAPLRGHEAGKPEPDDS